MKFALSQDYLASAADRVRAASIDIGVFTAIFVIFMVLAIATGVVAMATAGYFAFAGFWIFQIVLLTKDGQTIGKRLSAIRIVNNKTGEKASLVRVVLLRLILNGIIGVIIPPYWLVDGLFILRRDRRAIHDLIAGTRVIDVRTE